MKKLTFLSLVLIFCVSALSAQETAKEFKPSGKAFGKVFWNYHYDMTSNVDKSSAFELKRSYFGYKYNFTKELSTKITFDVGNNDSGSAYTAFLKTAQLDWKAAKGVKISLGLIGLKQFNDQEHFWGYRYIYKSFQDQHGFGSSADLGINAEFTLAKNLKANFLIINGEGYKKIQDADGQQKVGGSLVFTPVKGLTTKVYIDNQPTTGGDDITTYSFFAGYKADAIRFGAEFNQQNNATKYAKPAADKNLWGWSFYSTYTINKKFEIFARYDNLDSNILSGETVAWNNAKDGSAILGGVQFAPVKGVKMALNYQNWSFADSSLDNQSKLYVNFEFKF